MKFEVGDKVFYRTKGLTGTVAAVFYADAGDPTQPGYRLSDEHWRYYIDCPNGRWSVPETSLLLSEKHLSGVEENQALRSSENG